VGSMEAAAAGNRGRAGVACRDDPGPLNNEAWGRFSGGIEAALEQADIVPGTLWVG